MIHYGILINQLQKWWRSLKSILPTNITVALVCINVFCDLIMTVSPHYTSLMMCPCCYMMNTVYLFHLKYNSNQKMKYRWQWWNFVWFTFYLNQLKIISSYKDYGRALCRYKKYRSVKLSRNWELMRNGAGK